jgi:DNA-binding MarR family transcriptional regulator
VQTRRHPPAGPRLPRSTAFLLAQVGAHAASRFADRLSEVKLSPPHAGILRAITASPGISQQELAVLLRMLPSRLVSFIDDLEGRGLLERQDNPDDRRQYALRLTEKGTKVMSDLGRIARAHDEATCAALSDGEREQLASLLGRIADEQGLTPGVHPGFGRAALGSGPAGKGTRPDAPPAAPARPGRGRS